MKWRLLGMAVVIIIVSTPTWAEEAFTCRLGTRPACLQYSDQVVDRSAVCFNNFACGIATNADDFICKKKAKEAVLELESFGHRVNANYRAYMQCVFKATTLREAKSCEPQY